MKLQKGIKWISIINVFTVTFLAFTPLYVNGLGKTMLLYDVSHIAIGILYIYMLAMTVFMIAELRRNTKSGEILYRLRKYVVYYTLLVFIIIIQCVVLIDSQYVIEYFNIPLIHTNINTPTEIFKYLRFGYGIYVLMLYFVLTLLLNIRLYVNPSIKE